MVVLLVETPKRSHNFSSNFYSCMVTGIKPENWREIIDILALIYQEKNIAYSQI